MYYIGIDIGGTSIKSCIADDLGNILAKASRPTKTFEYLVGDIVSMCNELLEATSLTASDIKAAGIGVPGMVDAESGVITYANNLKMENLPIVEEFNEFFNILAYIANDADAAALGELCFGSGKGKKNIVFVTLGTGVGTGIILDGKLIHGSEGGHMIIETDGELCSCGNRGCFECYASATAMKRLTKKHIEENPDGMLAELVKEKGISAKPAFDCAKAGDEKSIELVEKYLDYIATGVANLANIFCPECVLIGGGISNESPEYFAKVESKANQKVFGSAYRTPISVVPASLKNDAGMLGAVALAMSAENK